MFKIKEIVLDLPSDKIYAVLDCDHDPTTAEYRALRLAGDTNHMRLTTLQEQAEIEHREFQRGWSLGRTRAVLDITKGFKKFIDDAAE